MANALRGAIQRGEYPPNEWLPNEGRLAEEFQVSRGTVRAALKILENEGRIGMRQGRGVYVRDFRPIVHLAAQVPGGTDAERFTDGYAPQLREAGYDRISESIEVQLETMRPKVAKRFGLPAEAEHNGSPQDRLVVLRQCDRFVDGRLWERQITHYPYSIAAETELMSPEHITDGIDQVLGRLGYTEDWSWDIVGARMPSPREVESFGVGHGIPLLVQERVAYAGDRVTRFTETTMPADRHQLLYAGGDAPAELLLLASDVSIFER
ncbi:GntR family transcriptional regulator [Murinocardiopsis flavida]|uniref:GntR family transcriptional regulator n=1 Tax=Murinocardiopsis flavida TaxID=645275 RepID=A0A2P8CQW4_9ACTN|nr:GntR family transcriptional regulator [Murinocardiopsis flavida]